jgi:hypothetical protein
MNIPAAAPGKRLDLAKTADEQGVALGAIEPDAVDGCRSLGEGSFEALAGVAGAFSYSLEHFPTILSFTDGQH